MELHSKDPMTCQFSRGLPGRFNWTQLGSADTYAGKLHCWLRRLTQLSLCIVGRLDAEAATSPRETFEKIYRNTVRVEKQN